MCGTNNCNTGKYWTPWFEHMLMDCCTKPNTKDCDPRKHPIKSAECCHSRNPCSEGQGDCDHDHDCLVFESLLPISGFLLDEKFQQNAS